MDPEGDLQTQLKAVAITEDEAALYDRQIRLWGLEAQQRMRNAVIMVLNLRGVASETIKNIVLAGIGKILLVDNAIVSEEDLGAGFLFRDEDVGRKRVDAARPHVEALNPLVTVQSISDVDVSSHELLLAYLDTTLPGVDLLCATESAPSAIAALNASCRKHNTLFYAGGTYGLMGYVFCDLQTHHYVAPDRTQQAKIPSQQKMVKQTETYVPFSDALNHRWDKLTKRQTKEVNPLNFFLILALWEYQSRHSGKLPDVSPVQSDATSGDSEPPPSTDELKAIADEVLAKARVNKQVLSQMPRDVVQQLAESAAHEFSPVCAIVGGLLAQDLLKALAGREPPYANLLVFDGVTGNGNVVRMGM